MDGNNKWSWKYRLQSFRHAWNGICTFLRIEPHAIIHLIATLLVIVLNILLRVDTWEWGILLGCIGMVWIAEMLNTALEKLCDAVHPAVHPLIKQCKDIASGSVLIAAIISMIVAGIIYVTKLL